jgi:hypothetical protein
MFDSNSRYAKSETAEADAGTRGTVRVVKLRRLPYAAGNLTEVKGTDRLDIMAHRKYKDGTEFWHVADANTELEANHLTARERSENPLAKEETKYILTPEN